MRKYGLQRFQETKSCQPSYLIILTKKFLKTLKLYAVRNIKRGRRSFLSTCGAYTPPPPKKTSCEIVQTPITFHLAKSVSLILQMTHLIRIQKVPRLVIAAMANQTLSLEFLQLLEPRHDKYPKIGHYFWAPAELFQIISTCHSKPLALQLEQRRCCFIFP